MQEIKSASDQGSFIDQDIHILHSERNLSKRFSLSRSISRESSGIGNCSGHSFSISFAGPTAINTLETSAAEPNTSASAPVKVPQEVSLRRLALLNKPEIPILLSGSILAVISGMVFPAYGVVLSKVVKTYFEPLDKIQKDSNLWALTFVGLGVVSLFLSPSKSFLFGVAGCRLIRRIRSMCFEKVVFMEVSWFDEAENSSGAIGARLSTDTASMRSLVGDALALLVQNSATAVAGLVVAFAASWQVALIILVMLPLQGLNGYAQMKFMTGFSADAKVHSIAQTLQKNENNIHFKAFNSNDERK